MVLPRVDFVHQNVFFKLYFSKRVGLVSPLDGKRSHWNCITFHKQHSRNITSSIISAFISVRHLQCSQNSIYIDNLTTSVQFLSMILCLVSFKLIFLMKQFLTHQIFMLSFNVFCHIVLSCVSFLAVKTSKRSCYFFLMCLHVLC